MNSKLYFSGFESRRPPVTKQFPPLADFIWKSSAITTLGLGIWYLNWRWTASLNPEALTFSIIVALAETLAYLGLVLFFYNLWSQGDTTKKPPPISRADCIYPAGTGPICIDIFIATFNEDPELLRLSIIDAVAVRAPKSCRVKIHVIDDGNRPNIRQLAKAEGVHYITRAHNIGFKAGNLKNALAQTYGDFYVICDADTRLFPSFLYHTLGYFRVLDVAWVQTPHWFYDIPEGRPLGDILTRSFGRGGGLIDRIITLFFGPQRLGEDPFSSDPSLFFDVIQRRRNRANGSFCCGASSIHRREAVMEAAIIEFGQNTAPPHCGPRAVQHPNLQSTIDLETLKSAQITPYKFHVSEDFYTSIRLHRQVNRQWISVYHPDIESKMLSPWSLESWAIQNFKYAGGTLDILIHDNPLFKPGLSWPQRLFYAATFWSYLSPIWVTILILAPIITLATGIAPVQSYSDDFYLHLAPLLLLHELAMVSGCWGHRPLRGKLLSTASFALIFQALYHVLRGRQIKFPTTPKTGLGGRHLPIVFPHIVLIAATLIAFSIALARQMISPDPSALAALIVNGFWGANNILALWILVRAAFWQPPKGPQPIRQPKRNMQLEVQNGS